ncbi:TolC family protein [Candidatus Sumerlaeota bacterium]|nr:TolC family protein [Candidatus Sumerlaeota bacterium]
MLRCLLSIGIAVLLTGCFWNRDAYYASLEKQLETERYADWIQSEKDAEIMSKTEDSIWLPSNPDYHAALAKVESKQPLSREDCIALALVNSRLRPVSRYTLDIAEAQMKQAMSAYWPQLTLEAAATTQEKDPLFVFPASSYNFSAQSPAMTLPIPGMPIQIPAMTTTGGVDVPEQRVKIQDRQLGVVALKATWPLYTGGLRTALNDQARFGFEAARQEARRSDLQVNYDIQKYYDMAVFLHELTNAIDIALRRMESTLKLTESMYLNGSGTVDKTDFLRNKIFVETLRSNLAILQSQEKLARAVLAFSAGLEWTQEIELENPELPRQTVAIKPENAIGGAFIFNPDWNRVKAGLKAARAQLLQAQSGHYPKIALFGELVHLENDLDSGMMSNKDTWSAGVGMELPLFRGFRTINEVREAESKLERFKHQGILFREGLALQVKQALYTLEGSGHQAVAARDAYVSAQENRDLNIRAYRNELVETKDMIEAQLTEVLIEVSYLQSLHQHAQSLHELNFIVGAEVEKTIGELLSEPTEQE